MGDFFKELVEVRPLEEPVEEAEELCLVQHLEATHRGLYILRTVGAEGRHRIPSKDLNLIFCKINAILYL